MASDDGDADLSESDYDEDDGGFKEDMEALKRACFLTGTDPNDNLVTSTIASDDNDDDSDSDSDDDDMEFVKSLQRRVGIPNDVENQPPSFTFSPLGSLLPVGGGGSEDGDVDHEEDLETLCAIRRRFAAYDDVGSKESEEVILPEIEQVGATNITSEKDLFVKRNNDEKGFPNCVDVIEVAPQESKASRDVVCEEQPTNSAKWHDDYTGGEILPALTTRTISSLPKSALLFIDAIKKNRSCQKVIRSKMVQVEARTEEIKKLMERVKILKDFEVGCKKRTSLALSQKKDPRVQLISLAKRRRGSEKVNDKKIPAMRYGPPENCQVANYREVSTRFPLPVAQKSWSKKDKENLAKGVKQQIQEILLQQSVNLMDDADNSCGDSSNFDRMITSIRDLDITPENIRQFLPRVNWEHLASMYLPDRSGAECEARWLNYEDPLINCNHWSKMETKKLLHVIQHKGINNWVDIAVSLGTNRTPFQCLARYQRTYNTLIMKSEWTKEDDYNLRAAVEEFGEHNWQAVAPFVGGKTGTQCSNRWKKTLNPTRTRAGTWTAEEDKHLKVAVTLLGPRNWKKVAEFVPGRIDIQCRERWTDHLAPSLNMNKWTTEEDAMLKVAFEKHGICWSKIAASIPSRTDSQCRLRLKSLFPDEVASLQAAKKTLKAAVISNFVDRESERTALEPNDFVPLTSIPPAKINSAAKQKNKLRRRAKQDRNIHLKEVSSLTNGRVAKSLSHNSAVTGKKEKVCSKRKRSNGVADHVSSSCDNNSQEIAHSCRENIESGKNQQKYSMLSRCLGNSKTASTCQRSYNVLEEEDDNTTLASFLLQSSDPKRLAHSSKVANTDMKEVSCSAVVDSDTTANGGQSEDDNTTLASFLQSANPQNQSYPLKDANLGIMEVDNSVVERNAKSKNVGSCSRSKRSRTGKKALSHDKLEAERADDMNMTLASFSKKLKKGS